MFVHEAKVGLRFRIALIGGLGNTISRLRQNLVVRQDHWRT
jgi:hypothetical protein